MQTCDLRLDAGWIVPIEPAGALADHALIVDAGRIVARRARRREADAALRGARARRAAAPRAAAGPRQRAHARGDDASSAASPTTCRCRSGSSSTSGRARRGSSAPEFVYDGAPLAAAEMLRGGVTCCNDMYFFPDASARAFLETRACARCWACRSSTFPTPYAADADGYLAARPRDPRRAEARAAASRFRCRRTRRTPWATRPGRRSSSTRASSTCRSRPTSPRPRTKSRRAVAEHGRTPLARLHDLGATGPQFIAIHGVHLAADDIALLAAQGCHVVHCPVSNMKLGSGIAPVSALLAARRQRRARHRRRGVEQPARPFRRDAHRRAAGQGGDRRSVGAARAAGAARGDARRRARAGPRRARSARSSPASRRTSSRSTCRRSTRCPVTIRFRISSTRWAARRSPTSGSPADGWSRDRALHDRRRGGDSPRRARLWQERLQ